MKPDLKFLIQHPAHFIALGFGSGLAPKAPGTFGTLVAFPLYWLIADNSPDAQILTIIICFVAGIFFCGKTGKALGVPDHGAIVWDEIVAMVLVLTTVPNEWGWWLIAFALFRLFDIWKPFPIGFLDEKLKNGFGVMLDDLLAALYSIFHLQIMLWMISSI
jgi:phosphatidylglycerophosphatase A